jgi:predicted RecB family nuclease
MRQAKSTNIKQAEKDDNLSLLSHATAKVLKHYEKKGIFTVKQLSYLYKPRRRNKRAKKSPLRLHNLELQSLAIETNKIYLHELPQLTRKPIELFLDIEGIPDEQYEYLIRLLVCDETNPCKHCKSFLKFLLSKEKDIDRFKQKKS